MSRQLLLACAALAFGLTLSACVGAGAHRQAVEDPQGGDRLTPGKVQMSISKGMPQSEVLQALGNPNIVSTDAESRQVWTWDRMSTTEVRSSESGGVGVWMLVGPGYSAQASAASRSQRTMTLIIYFDQQNKVRDLAYHSSSF